MLRKCRNAAFAVALSLVAAATGADARVWSKNPAMLAQDYLIIQDQRATGDIVLVFWLASPLVPASTTGAEPARKLLDSYALIGVAHMKLSAQGVLTPVPEGAAQLNEAGGAALPAVGESEFPPTMSATLALLKNLFAKTLGPFGSGVAWTVFKAPAHKPCEAGGLRVNYAGTVYTYDTPIPGCS